MRRVFYFLQAILCVAGLSERVAAQRTLEEMVDLSHVPRGRETAEQRDARMQWFRDAKFGMFIHWGPCSVGAKEIGWGRDGNRTFDVSFGYPGTRNTPDPVYDNYYQQFNPVHYDADAWVTFARESGMKYMVLITKHHDGFAQFDSKVSDYDIMATPYGRDIVREFAEACHRQGMKFGLYYSTRDWYHPDYMQGDNAIYDAFYRTQVEELLSNYGNVDIMWFDHVGGQDWSKWRFDKLFAMMYRLQPHLLVNDRAAKFCGRGTGAKPRVGPVTPALRTMTQGDYYTPEGRIGTFDIFGDWESCIHVGQGWSYRGEDGFKKPEECIRMLSSTVTGGGNLLLNFGPRPDGTFVEGEARVARAMGKWLQTYGDAVYDTRGGPYRSGVWGGSCHKGSKLYLHVQQWPESGLSLDPLPYTVLEARTLDGAPAIFRQDAGELVVQVAEEDRKLPVTIVELTVDRPVVSRQVVGGLRSPMDALAQYGDVLSDRATLEISSRSPDNRDGDHPLLFTEGGATRGFAFNTQREHNPWARVDLGEVQEVHAVRIEPRFGDGQARKLTLSVSEDGESWEQVWQAKKLKAAWVVPLSRFELGADVPGRPLRYLRLETRGKAPRSLMLHRVTVLGHSE